MSGIRRTGMGDSGSIMPSMPSGEESKSVQKSKIMRGLIPVANQNFNQDLERAGKALYNSGHDFQAGGDPLHLM